MCVHACVCVSLRERERERERVLILDFPGAGVGRRMGADDREDIVGPTHLPTHFIHELEVATACRRRDAPITGL